MDTTTITHLSLCSGYGGIDLGLRREIPNLRTVAYAEIEAFACELLLARMEGGQIDSAPVWPNLKTFPWESFRDRVDILSGGYPCQPFSAAGKRLGKEDPRHLWPYIADGIRILRPKLCFFENVEGHISLGLRDVIEELGCLDYSASWGIFSASEVGAPHQRKRVFILAYRNNTRLERYWRYVAEHDSQGRQAPHGQPWPSRPGELQHGWEPPRVVGNANGDGRQRNVSGDEAEQDSNGQNDRVSGSADTMGNPNSPRPQERKGQREEGIQRANADGGADTERQTEPALGGDAHGLAGGLDYAELSESCDNRTDELRLLGNGVVPAVAALAFRTLMNQLKNT